MYQRECHWQDFHKPELEKKKSFLKFQSHFHVNLVNIKPGVISLL